MSKALEVGTAHCAESWQLTLLLEWSDGKGKVFLPLCLLPPSAAYLPKPDRFLLRETSC